MRKALALLLALSMVVSLFAGGSKESGDEQIVIEFWTHEDVNRQALEDRYIQEFMETHPNVTVNVTRQASTKLIELVQTAFAAGEGPTMFNLSISDEYPYIVAGRVAPVDYEAAGYADAHRVGAVGPMEIPKVAKDAGCDLAMLDTAVKDGKTLFDFLNMDELKEFVDEAHRYGLKTALAGSVKKDQLKPLHDIGCDVVGIRGAACVGGDRNTGHIHHTAVAELKELCESFDN